MSERGKRYEAMQLGLSRYSTGVACKRGHDSERVTKTGTCVECRRVGYVVRYRENPEKYREKSRKYKSFHLEEDREKRIAKYWENPEEAREYGRINSKLWRKRHPGIRSANTKFYKLLQKQGVPAWANKEKIKQIYIEAAKTGLSVDHIIPLRGKTVSGFHVETNLRLIPLIDNTKKRNNFDESLL